MVPLILETPHVLPGLLLLFGWRMIRDDMQVLVAARVRGFGMQ